MQQKSDPTAGVTSAASASSPEHATSSPPAPPPPPPTVADARVFRVRVSYLQLYNEQVPVDSQLACVRSAPVRPVCDPVDVSFGHFRLDVIRHFPNPHVLPFCSCAF